MTEAEILAERRTYPEQAILIKILGHIINNYKHYSSSKPTSSDIDTAIEAIENGNFDVFAYYVPVPVSIESESSGKTTGGIKYTFNQIVGYKLNKTREAIKKISNATSIQQLRQQLEGMLKIQEYLKLLYYAQMHKTPYYFNPATWSK